MKLWLKIVCAILLVIFLAIYIIEFIQWSASIINDNVGVYNAFEFVLTIVQRYLLPIFLCTLNIIFLFKKSPEFKYEYQYYIEQKQAKKKQKLQEKLDKMEKGE